MTKYKNIYSSLNDDFNYLLVSNEYWFNTINNYKCFIDFVKVELINDTDLKILQFISRNDKSINNPIQFVNSLKNQYLLDVENFCKNWKLPLAKETVKNG